MRIIIHPLASLRRTYICKVQKAQAKRALAKGVWKILIEAEGVFENVSAEEDRYDFVDYFVTDFNVKDLIFEGAGQAL